MRPLLTLTQAINAAMDNDSNEKQAGLTFPGFFGVLANRYFYGTPAPKKAFGDGCLEEP